MKNHPLIRDLLAEARRKEQRFTLLGIGPVSGVVVRATMEACKKNDCPPMFIASRNQVDLKELGHGYLMGGMDQKAFIAFIQQVAREVDYRGPVYVCRDHGGPWQRNVELDGQYPLAKAMKIAKQSFRADIEAGFNYIHIDPTKCPFPNTRDNLCEWTVELIDFCEQVRKECGRGPIDYEVGAEDIQGGLTTGKTCGYYLRRLSAELKARSLPIPTCVVGQTGTLTRADRNVGRLDLKGTKRLIQVAQECEIGFKEHNGDYLSAASCAVHPELGISGMNVAPEFGLVQTDALLYLADLEGKLVREGWVKERSASNLAALLREKTFRNAPWKKWLPEEMKSWPPERMKDDNAARLLIARVCGHYVYDDRAVAAAIEKLYANVQQHRLVANPRMYVIGKVQAAIEFYIGHFRMTGLNRLLKEVAGTGNGARKKARAVV